MDNVKTYDLYWPSNASMTVTDDALVDIVIETLLGRDETETDDEIKDAFVKFIVDIVTVVDIESYPGIAKAVRKGLKNRD